MWKRRRRAESQGNLSEYHERQVKADLEVELQQVNDGLAHLQADREQAGPNSYMMAGPPDDNT